MSELQIQTLGQTRILVSGAEIKWPAQSARELLLYLLSFPEGRTKHQLFEDLWQREVDAAGNNRFRVTMHRLHTALGVPQAVSEEHGRYRLSPDVWRQCDIYTFYQALGDAELQRDTVPKKAALQRAITLYGGDFLAGESAGVGGKGPLGTQGGLRAGLIWNSACCAVSTTAAYLSVLAIVWALKTDPYVGEQYHQRLMACLSVVESKYTVHQALPALSEVPA